MMSWDNGKRLSIAVSGKGGVGKTNLAALIIRTLSKVGSLLAIDADPDSNLPQALGVNVRNTIGNQREAIMYAPIRSETTLRKPQALEVALSDAIEEFADFDVVVMGRSEGEGCYCGVNNIIRQVIDFRSDSYNFTVIDCEAGLEHLSRRTTRDIDFLLLITGPTKNGILTAKRIKDLSQELAVNFGTVLVVANKVTSEVVEVLNNTAAENGLEVFASVPYDSMLAEFDIVGRPVMELSEDSPASLAVADLCNRILNYEGGEKEDG